MSTVAVIEPATFLVAETTDPRLSRRAATRANIAELELELLGLQEDYLEQRAMEAKRAAADQQHAETCAPLQEALRSTINAAERLKIREKISAANIMLDATCRELDANISRLNTNHQRGKVSGQLEVLRAELRRAPLANPALLLRAFALKDRFDFCRARVDSWAEKVAKIEAALGVVAGRKFGPLSLGNAKPDGSQIPEPESEVAPLYRERLGRFRAALADAQEQLAAAATEHEEILAAIVNE